MLKHGRMPHSVNVMVPAHATCIVPAGPLEDPSANGLGTVSALLTHRLGKNSSNAGAPLNSKTPTTSPNSLRCHDHGQIAKLSKNGINRPRAPRASSPWQSPRLKGVFLRPHSSKSRPSWLISGLVLPAVSPSGLELLVVVPNPMHELVELNFRIVVFIGRCKQLITFPEAVLAHELVELAFRN